MTHVTSSSSASRWARLYRWASKNASVLVIMSYLALTIVAVWIGNTHVKSVSKQWLATAGIELTEKHDVLDNAPLKANQDQEPKPHPAQIAADENGSGAGRSATGNGNQPTPLSPSCSESRVRSRILDQRSLALKRRDMNVSIGVYFYARHFTSVTLATIFSVLAGTLVLLVAQKGWPSSGRILRSSMLYTLTAGAFFGVSPAIFKQGANVEAVMARATKYENLIGKIDTYLATECLLQSQRTKDSGGERGVDVTACKQTSGPEFVSMIEIELAQINSLLIGFDAGAVPELPEGGFGNP